MIVGFGMFCIHFGSWHFTFGIADGVCTVFVVGSFRIVAQLFI